MKREASRDDAHRLLNPAVSRAQHDPLEVWVSGDVLVERRQRIDRVEVILFGRLDDPAAEAVERSLPTGPSQTLVLDLTHLNGIAAAALHRLIDRQQADHDRGRQLLLRIAPGQVSRLRAVECEDQA
jgi:hypothetical protein